jgi:hypothetical protein
MTLLRFLRTGAFALVAFAVSAHADYDRALAAVQRGDANAAYKEFRAAAEAGDERAFVQVARAYAYGVGTQPDPRAAEIWAQKSAVKGSADGQFLVYALTVARPELNFFDRQGRIDAQRYQALAARPISGREDEMNAYDMLGKAAGQGHRDATLSLAGFYADNVGDGNRKRAEELLDKLPQRPPVFDGLRNCNAVKPVRAQRMGPVNKPIWLPLAVPELKTAYLMSGEWRERWTFDVCGAETVLHIMFVADGLGGAKYTIDKER